MTRGIERQELAAELAAVRSLLAEIPSSRVLERRGLESRVRRLSEQMARLRSPGSRNAEVALFFGGDPVTGVHGIAADFAGPAVEHFNQLVVAKGNALAGALGTTPTTGEALHITGTVHGSFGFRMEELTRPLVGDTDLHAAVHETMQLLARLQEPITPEIEDAITSESRAFYDALKGFLRTLHDRSAVVRIVGDDEEVQLDQNSIGAAVKALLAIDVQEEVVEHAGVFGGSLDFSGKFEFRDDDLRKVVTGKLAKELSPATLDAFHHQPCRARMRVMTSTHGQRTRTTYTLLGLSPLPKLPTAKSGG